MVKAITSTDKAEKELVMPEQSENFRQMFAYMIKTRKIPPHIIEELVKAKLLYQTSFKHNLYINHNAVFVHKNQKGEVVGGEIQGCNSSQRFKGVVSGTQDSCFIFTPYPSVNGSFKRAYIFESSIDLMSFYSYCNKEKIKETAFISMAGLKPTVPKRLQEQGVQIISCVDNDDKGRKFEKENGFIRPDGSKQFIRLNSLGEEYSMQGIINRINNNVFYQNNISENIYKQTEKKIYVGVLHVAQLYFGAFVDNCLPIKKIRQNEPYSWRNDAELDRLAKINNLVCQGADLDTFRQRYSDSEQAFTELQLKIEALEKQLSIKNAMYKYADIFYGEAETTEQLSNTAKKVMQNNPQINQSNYKSILKMIENDKQELNNLKQQLDVLTDKLNETKDQLNTIQKIYAGTYMQSLLRDADIERYADEIPSGLDDEIMSL